MYPRNLPGGNTSFRLDMRIVNGKGLMKERRKNERQGNLQGTLTSKNPGWPSRNQKRAIGECGKYEPRITRISRITVDRRQSTAGRILFKGIYEIPKVARGLPEQPLRVPPPLPWIDPSDHPSNHPSSRTESDYPAPREACNSPSCRTRRTRSWITRGPTALLASRS